MTDLSTTSDILPRLAFGEEEQVYRADLETYRTELARAVPAVRSCEALGSEPFAFKAKAATVNGTTVIASANTPMQGFVGEMPSPVVQVILSGSSTFLCDGCRHDCGPGSIIYLPEQERFGQSGTRSLLTLAVERGRLLGAYEAICGSPPGPAAAAALSNVVVRQPTPLFARILDSIVMVAGLIDKSLGNQRALDILVIDEVLHRLVAMAIWPALWSGEGSTAGRQAVPELRLSTIEEYIRANIAEPIQVSSLARHAGVSTRLVHQLFLRTHGVTPAQYIRDARLDAARAMLLDPHATPRIRHIAARYGFSRSSLFTTHYRRRFGETPAATRSRLKCTPAIED